jgi:hypothetical protein
LAGVQSVKRPIVAFRQDNVGDWVAVLACGHGQHVRHTPPMFERPWVLDPAGRARFIGYTLNCRVCDSDHMHAVIPGVA